MLFCLFTIVPNMWPGWATSGVTILTFLMGGGNVPLITIGVLVASGIALTDLARRVSDARARAVLQGGADARLSG